MITRYYERSPGEAQLLALQRDFFRIIDETAVPQNILGSTNDQLLKQYLDKYFDLAARSLKPVLRTCPRSSYRDPLPCEIAARDYEAMLKRQKDRYLAHQKLVPSFASMPRHPDHRPFVESLMRARVDAVKKLIAERDADWEFMASALAKMLHF